LANPERCERLNFAEALVTRVDEMEISDTATLARPSARIRFLDRFRTPAPAMAFSVALAAILLFASGAWLFVSTTNRLRRELDEAQAARSSLEQHERELEQQVAEERSRADQLARESDRLRDTRGTGPNTSERLIASLILPIGGARGSDTGPPAKLVITRET